MEDFSFITELAQQSTKPHLVIEYGSRGRKVIGLDHRVPWGL